MLDMKKHELKKQETKKQETKKQELKKQSDGGCCSCFLRCWFLRYYWQVVHVSVQEGKAKAQCLGSPAALSRPVPLLSICMRHERTAL